MTSHRILQVMLWLGMTCFAQSVSAGPGKAGKDSSASLVQVARIKGGLSPKSVVWNGHDRFFVQNMMYRHTVSVYDADLQPCGVISDRVSLEALGICDRPGTFRGAPVECTFTGDGRYAFVSNYTMEGAGFDAPGCDNCSGAEYDGSFVYKVDAATLQVVKAFPTGSVPKYLTLTPDERTLLVSNWSSGDLSLIDLSGQAITKRIPVGRFPRGIAVDPQGHYAYIAIMGSNSIKRLDLRTHVVEHFVTVGTGPRHLCMDAKGQQLYASLNHEGAIARIDLTSRAVRKVHVGGAPRSMVMGNEERSLYVVNYSANRMTKVDLASFSVADTIGTDARPIGIAYDARNKRVWVACYSGSVQVFEDRNECSTGDPTLADAVTGSAPLDSCSIFQGTRSTSTSPDNTVTPPTRRQAIADPIEQAGLPGTVSGNVHAVVAGSFRDAGNAQRQRTRLEHLGHAPRIVRQANGLYQVLVGTFTNEQEAQALGRAMKEHGISTWIDTTGP